MAFEVGAKATYTKTEKPFPVEIKEIRKGSLSKEDVYYVEKTGVEKAESTRFTCLEGDLTAL